MVAEKEKNKRHPLSLNSFTPTTKECMVTFVPAHGVAWLLALLSSTHPVRAVFYRSPHWVGEFRHQVAQAWRE